MNTRRTIFWLSFVIILVLIIWGLIVAMNKPIDVAKLAAPAPVTVADHVSGASNSLVTLIEYGDFQCPACRTYFPYVERLMNESSSTARLVFRHFPLGQHVNAVPAALVAEAASLQGKFWDMYRTLYENQDEWAELDDPTAKFTEYAQTLGLDMTRFNNDKASSTLKQIILANQDEGIKIGINSTPTFFVNGVVVSPKSYDEFKSFIDTAAQAATK